MASNSEDIYRRLTALLLKGPRDPLAERSAVYRLNRDILSKFNFSPRETPVIGVALSLEEKGSMEISIFLRKEIHGFSEFLTETLKLRDFRVRQHTTGIISASGRPTVGGESLGEGATNGKSGTFGCLVEDAAGDHFLLSCNHVLSDVNSGNKGNDVVWQPSFKDGGRAKDRIGILHDFAHINIGGVQSNEIDAALAKPDIPSDAKDGLRTIGTINGTASHFPYRMSVEKIGWKTNQTSGTFLYRTSFINHYKGHGDALFEDQLGIVGTTGKFSEDGDSGAVVINGKKEAVGLVFANAADIDMTFANRINKVFSYFGVTPA